MALWLDRAGTFSVTSERYAAQENQCGAVGQQMFVYKVRIHATPGLDERGFILDNKKVQHYFDSGFRNLTEVPSCERIAMQAARALAAMCRTATRVDVTISAAGYDASVTASFYPNRYEGT